jgi:hypothetical protein
MKYISQVVNKQQNQVISRDKGFTVIVQPNPVKPRGFA